MIYIYRYICSTAKKYIYVYLSENIVKVIKLIHQETNLNLKNRYLFLCMNMCIE